MPADFGSTGAVCATRQPSGRASRIGIDTPNPTHSYAADRVMERAGSHNPASHIRNISAEALVPCFTSHLRRT